MDPPSDPPVLTAPVLDELRRFAEQCGLLRLSAVRLDHPGFAPAAAHLDRYLDEGRHGEMDFMARTREVRKDPTAMLPGARTAIVVAVPYEGEAGSIARYAQGVDYHVELHRRLEPVQRWIEDRLPGTETLACVDSKPILERATAALAGMGFLGKNGCLIVPGLGSYLLLGVLLCTAELDGPDAVDDPLRVRWDACGACTKCLDACPTAAFDRPGELDPRRCISYLTIEHRGPIAGELLGRLGERIAGCDVCQEVCPYNAAADRRHHRVDERAWLPDLPDGPRAVDLVALTAVRTGRYRAFVRDTALRRIPRRQLRRNALLALGNRPGELTSEERAAVELAARDDEPIVAEAARWVLARRAGSPSRHE